MQQRVDRQQKKTYKKVEQQLKKQLSFLLETANWKLIQISLKKFQLICDKKAYSVNISQKDIEVIDIYNKDIYYLSL